ncbi:restriction endonuclease subunit S [Vibrio cholerae]|uniref:restriction endonuclease subunit S n=1 Tax=Vibrio cholerae TaxID=666 RepID=UPI001372E3A9|nr:restriction endonuclease subunit S [Vibrio cholerae]NAR40795.1 restriction endonuclease subunit S [Vibrio cholerae]
MSWPLVAFASIAEVVTGNTPSKADDSFFGGDIPFVTPGELDLGFVDNANQTLTEKGAKVSRLIPANSVMVCCIGSLGKVGISSVPVVTNQQINSLVINQEVAYPLYVYYFCKTLKNTLNDMAPKTTVAIVNKTKFSALKIPLPPLETQKQIAAVLEKADQLRKDCKLLEQELNNLAQSVFIDMFGDPLTNPKGWEVRKLKEFYISEKDGTKCGPFGSALKKEEFVESGVPVWNMDNIALNGTFRDGASLWITKQKYEELDKYSVNQGDVIISRAGTVGKMGVVKSIYEQSIISTNLIRVRFGDKLDPLYFVCLMTYFKTRLKRLKVGDDGSFSHMNTGILDQLEFPYPPVEEQQKYIQFRSKLDDEIERLTSLKNEHECNFNSLMQKAFKGELTL